MKHIFPKSNYVVFDFETTGLDASNCQVIQMSAIKLKDGQWVEPFNKFIKCSTPLPDLIVNLTQITNAILDADGVEEKQGWEEFAQYIENFPLVGHNVVGFDRLFLETAFKKFNIVLPNPGRYVDTAMLYKAIKLDKQPLWYENHFAFAKRISEIRAFGVKFNLQLCCQELGIDTSQFQAHRSDADIEMTNLIYQHFLNL